MLSTVIRVVKPHMDNKIILSVSGGVDSVVLLYLLQKLGCNLIVVHFNHQKRAESIIEAEYVKKLASNFSYPFEYFELDIKEDFQNEAHKARKNLLIEVARRHITNTIITAHHANDLLETILMKLSRGSNLLGYSGFVESYHKDGFYFLKPLLTIPKEEIIAYAKEENITYFEDSSNTSSTYTRNRYRHDIIPSLLEENPLLLDKIIQYNKTLSDAFFHIRKETISFLNQKRSFIISQFENLDTSVRQDIIGYLLETEDIDISYLKVNQIIAFLENASPNAFYDVGKGFVFQKVYNKVFFEKKRKIIPIHQELNLDAFNVLKDNTFIEFSLDLADLDNYSINLCYNKLALPLVIRNRQAGDVLYFHFGHKKVKDYYIDKKIPVYQRDTDLFIVDKDNQVLAILGRYYNQNPNNKDRILMNFKRG